METRADEAREAADMQVDVKPDRTSVPGPQPWTRRWWFRLALVAAAFSIPPLVGSALDPTEIPRVVAEVLKDPIIVQVPMLLPLAKLLLLAVMLVALWSRTASARIVLGGYAAALVIVGVLQNMGNTPTYGFVWLAGNTAMMLVVATRCVWDLARGQTAAGPSQLRPGRLWVLAPMLLAFGMPYAVEAGGAIVPAFGQQVITNEAAVTYCMITPVVIGALLLYARPVFAPTLSLICFVGLYFGILNLIIWWGLQPRNWWMGVLHLPLVVLAVTGLIVSREAAGRPQGPADLRPSGR
jgi:hypothetical protein